MNVCITNIKVILFILFTFIVMAGCTFHIKSDDVVDFRRYSEIKADTPVTQAKSILGVPSGMGTHIYNGSKHKIESYMGIYGDFGLFSGTYSSGYALLTYDGDNISRLIAMTRTKEDGKQSYNTDKSIHEATSNIILKQTNISQVVNIFEKPLNSNGVLYYNDSNIDRKLYY